LLEELNAIQRRIGMILPLVRQDSAFSDAHRKVAVLMEQSLSACVSLLDRKGRHYRETVCRTLWGFHNLPRAFLSDEHSEKITSEDALRYFRAYLLADD